MKLYELQSDIKVQPGPAELSIPLACAEELPLPVEAISIPETAEKLVLETPIQPVSPIALEQPFIASKDQIRVLIVDDNEINLKVSHARENPVALSH